MDTMKLNSRRQSGVTLVEMLISIGLVVMVLAVVLAGHLYGLRLYMLCQSKLQASQTSRDMVKYMISEIYSAANIYVGSTYTTPFNAITNVGSLRQGNALQIWLDTTNYVCYYLDSGSMTLRRATSNGGTSTLGESIAMSGGAYAFTLRNFQGQVLTNETGNVSVNVKLEFHGTNYPTSQKMDYNKFETTVTRRSSFSS